MLTRSRAGRLVISSAAIALVVSALGPVTAEAEEGSEDHSAGSQIAKHEGTGEMLLSPPGLEVGRVDGIDVSSHQGAVDWGHWWRSGKRFAYVKATEGTNYRNPNFTQQYNGSAGVGMTRGSYHFALPDRSDGATQARFFVANGGGWSKDGRTLPGTLDIEYNPYGETCYGMTAGAMVGWIRGFSDTYHGLTGRWPVIYTSTQWWDRCTGRAGDFSSTNPLWLARYAAGVGPMPFQWPFHTIWQYTSSPIDQNVFNGGADRLAALASG
ncbi:lysozyme [Lentzea sp.]|uniref:lysozyme n=1 Tax=Lentzea sp. TaxID=56099 RepID=UPI002ED60321